MTTQELFEGNTRLAFWWARKFHRSHEERFKGAGIEVDDLAQHGLLGLWTAAREYDVARGFAFSTFASSVIRKRMQHALAHAGAQRRYMPVSEKIGTVASRSMSPADRLAEREAFASLRDELLQLPDDLLAIVLDRLDGKTLKQIGDERGTSKEAVRQRLLYAGRLLRPMLARGTVRAA